MRFSEWWLECTKLRDQVMDNPFGQVRAGVTLTRDCGLTRNVLEVEFCKDHNILITNDGTEMTSSGINKDYTTQKAAYAEVLKILTERTRKLIEQKEMILAAIVQDQIPNAAILRMEGNKDAGEISYEELLKTKVKAVVERLYQKFESVAKYHLMGSFDFEYPLTITFQEVDPGWKINLEKMSTSSITFSVGNFSCGNASEVGTLQDHLILLTNLKTIEHTLDKILKWLQAGKGL
jgi:hypothetical protein